MKIFLLVAEVEGYGCFSGFFFIICILYKFSLPAHGLILMNFVVLLTRIQGGVYATPQRIYTGKFTKNILFFCVIICRRTIFISLFSHFSLKTRWRRTCPRSYGAGQGFIFRTGVFTFQAKWEEKWLWIFHFEKLKSNIMKLPPFPFFSEVVCYSSKVQIASLSQGLQRCTVCPQSCSTIGPTIG